MTQSDAVLVDANVWLDYLFGDRANHEASKAFIMQAKLTSTPLVVTPHSLCNVFYIMQAQLKARNRSDGRLSPEEAASSAKAAAWAAVELIMELATVGPSDQMDARIALGARRVHGDFEDNMVVSCAMRIGARMLVTNDAQLLRHSTVVALSAEDAASALFGSGVPVRR